MSIRYEETIGEFEARITLREQAQKVVGDNKIPESCQQCFFLTWKYHPCGCGLKHQAKSLFGDPICEIFDFTKYLLEEI